MWPFFRKALNVAISGKLSEANCGIFVLSLHGTNNTNDLFSLMFHFSLLIMILFFAAINILHGSYSVSQFLTFIQNLPEEAVCLG